MIHANRRVWKLVQSQLCGYEKLQYEKVEKVIPTLTSWIFVSSGDLSSAESADHHLVSVFTRDMSCSHLYSPAYPAPCFSLKIRDDVEQET